MGEASHQPTVYSQQQAVGYKLTVPGQSKQLLAVRPPASSAPSIAANRAATHSAMRRCSARGGMGEASHQSTVYSRQQAVGYKLAVPGQSKQLLAVRPPRVPCACAVALRAVNRGKQSGDALRLAALFG